MTHFDQKSIPLKQASLAQSLPADCPLYFYEVIDSTNTRAKDLAQAFTGDKALFVAQEQTAGRGRYAKSFYSPKRSGIYASLLYRLKDPRQLESITPLTAVACYRAIRKVTGIAVDLKWVNDLFLGRKKVGGILCEAVASGGDNRIDCVIIGFGINVNPVQGIPDAFEGIIGHLSDGAVDLNQLLVEMVRQLLALLDGWPAIDFWADYKAQCLNLKEPFEVIRGNQRYWARGLDILRDGRLLIADARGQEEVLEYGQAVLSFPWQ